MTDAVPPLQEESPGKVEASCNQEDSRATAEDWESAWEELWKKDTKLTENKRLKSKEKEWIDRMKQEKSAADWESAWEELWKRDMKLTENKRLKSKEKEWIDRMKQGPAAREEKSTSPKSR